MLLIKAIDKDDGYQFIKSQFDVDTAIRDNTVLTQTQKNDALETLYNAQPHLQIGRYLTDIIRHSATIIDGTIIPKDNEGDETGSTFLEILQNVQSVQGLIPDLYGGGGSSALAIGTAAVRFSNNALVTFLNSVVADSTDFQTSLDNAVSQAAGNYSSLNTRISDALAGDPISELQAIREEINVQVNLENSNLVGIGSYIETLTNNISFSSLAEDKDLRALLVNVAHWTQTPILIKAV